MTCFHGEYYGRVRCRLLSDYTSSYILKKARLLIRDGGGSGGGGGDERKSEGSTADTVSTWTYVYTGPCISRLTHTPLWPSGKALGW